MTNSIRKGKRIERLLAERLRDLGFPAARRGQQFKGTEDSPDVVGVPLAHVESKGRKRIAGIQEWMAKAVSESGDRTPLVFLKADRWQDFLVCLTIRDWARIWHHFLDAADGIGVHRSHHFSDLRGDTHDASVHPVEDPPHQGPHPRGGG